MFSDKILSKHHKLYTTTSFKKTVIWLVGTTLKLFSSSRIQLTCSANTAFRSRKIATLVESLMIICLSRRGLKSSISITNHPTTVAVTGSRDPKTISGQVELTTIVGCPVSKLSTSLDQGAAVVVAIAKTISLRTTPKRCNLLRVTTVGLKKAACNNHLSISRKNPTITQGSINMESKASTISGVPKTRFQTQFLSLSNNSTRVASTVRNKSS